MLGSKHAFIIIINIIIVINTIIIFAIIQVLHNLIYNTVFVNVIANTFNSCFWWLRKFRQRTRINLHISACQLNRCEENNCIKVNVIEHFPVCCNSVKEEK